MSSEKLYKVFDKELIKNMNIYSKRNYYYLKDKEKINLEENKINELSSDPIFQIDDTFGEWFELRKTQSLFLNLEVSIDHTVGIFRGPKRVCFKDTILGLGLEWKHKNSKVKKCIKLGELSDENEDKFTVIIKDIEITNPDDEIEFYWFIYIAKQGTYKEIDDDNFGNFQGLILTKNLFWKLASYGNASMFPIEEKNIPSGPLWTISCAFSDWCYDDFSTENLSIILNRSHHLYPKIQYKGELFDIDFFKEILSSSLSSLLLNIIQLAKENNVFDDLTKEEKGETGSILSALHYFKNSLKFDLTGDTASLISSVKIFIDNGGKI